MMSKCASGPSRRMSLIAAHAGADVQSSGLTLLKDRNKQQAVCERDSECALLFLQLVRRQYDLARHQERRQALAHALCALICPHDLRVLMHSCHMIRHVAGVDVQTVATERPIGHEELANRLFSLASAAARSDKKPPFVFHTHEEGRRPAILPLHTVTRLSEGGNSG